MRGLKRAADAQNLEAYPPSARAEIARLRASEAMINLMAVQQDVKFGTKERRLEKKAERELFEAQRVVLMSELPENLAVMQDFLEGVNSRRGKKLSRAARG